MQVLPLSIESYFYSPRKQCIQDEDNKKKISLKAILSVTSVRSVVFSRILGFPPPIKLTHDLTEKLLKVALNTITP